MDDNEYYLSNIVQTNSSISVLNSDLDVKLKSILDYGRSPNSDRRQSEQYSRHIADKMATASEPQQQQQKLFRQHHLLLDYENVKSFDGVVRSTGVYNGTMGKQMSSSTTITTASGTSMDNNSSSSSSSSTHRNEQINSFANSTNSIGVSHNTTLNGNVNHDYINGSSEHNVIQVQQSVSRFETENSRFLSGGDYSNALLITIGIGCALLLFNVVIFAALYYQLDKNRKLVASQQKALDNKTEQVK